MDGLEVQERGHRPNDDGLFVPEDVKGFTETVSQSNICLTATQISQV